MKAASIIARLDRELIPRGFSRRKNTWNRAHDAFVGVIDIQISKTGDALTVNLGVLSKPVYFLCWGRDAEPFVEEPFCTVRTRLGSLIDKKDRWWGIGSAGVAEELIDCLGAQILPFLERMGSLEAMRDWLAIAGMPTSRSPLPSIYFAVLQSQLGDTRAGCAVLADLEKNALGAWKARAQEVALRIGCASAPTP